jgi:saccharopine dehydrogenase (NAD+, L-lysine forming)
MGPRAQVDASSAEAIAALAREHRATHVFNSVDPRFVMPIFDGAFAAGADYLDMAMSLSQKHPEKPYELTGVKLGDEQFAQSEDWVAGRPAGPGWDRCRAGTVGCLRAVRGGSRLR